jgi:hypothetical protein
VALHCALIAAIDICLRWLLPVPQGLCTIADALLWNEKQIHRLDFNVSICLPQPIAKSQAPTTHGSIDGMAHGLPLATLKALCSPHTTEGREVMHAGQDIYGPTLAITHTTYSKGKGTCVYMLRALANWARPFRAGLSHCHCQF